MQVKYNYKRAIPLALVAAGISVMIIGFSIITAIILVVCLFTGIEKEKPM